MNEGLAGRLDGESDVLLSSALLVALVLVCASINLSCQKGGSLKESNLAVKRFAVFGRRGNPA